MQQRSFARRRESLVGLARSFRGIVAVQVHAGCCQKVQRFVQVDDRNGPRFHVDLVGGDREGGGRPRLYRMHCETQERKAIRPVKQEFSSEPHTDLDHLRRALSRLPTADLQAFSLRREVPPAMDAIFSWLRHAAVWELQRRAGIHYELRDPMRDVDPLYANWAITALSVLEMHFAEGNSNSQVVGFLMTAEARIYRSPRV